MPIYDGRNGGLRVAVWRDGKQVERTAKNMAEAVKLERFLRGPRRLCPFDSPNARARVRRWGIAPDVPREFDARCAEIFGAPFDEKETSTVYLIAPVGMKLVKIGYASRLLSRVACIRADNHRPIRVLGLLRGGRAVEHALHVKFSEYRLRGEWFRVSGALAEAIRVMRDEAPVSAISYWDALGADKREVSRR